MSILRGCVVILILAGVVHAQDKTVSPNADPLAALTAEVRLLRLATEKATQVQTQIQGLSIFLYAQQSRLVQVSARLDGVRAELEGASERTRSIADRVALSDGFRNQVVSAEERAAIDSNMASLKMDLARAAARETQLRTRESEAFAELQGELARWTDLTSRLEQLIRQ